jgi:hypothetical protein
MRFICCTLEKGAPGAHRRTRPRIDRHILSNVRNLGLRRPPTADGSASKDTGGIEPRAFSISREYTSQTVAARPVIGRRARRVEDRMHRPSVYSLLLLTMALTAGACSKDPGTTVTPTPPEIAEPVWTGTLTVNGAAILPFTATDVGTVTAILNGLDPNNNATLNVGLDLGTWSGSSCTSKISNVTVGIGGGVVAFANGSGQLCARIYDSGYLTEPVTFTVKITHF